MEGKLQACSIIRENGHIKEMGVLGIYLFIFYMLLYFPGTEYSQQFLSMSYVKTRFFSFSQLFLSLLFFSNCEQKVLIDFFKHKTVYIITFTEIN